MCVRHWACGWFKGLAVCKDGLLPARPLQTDPFVQQCGHDLGPPTNYDKERSCSFRGKVCRSLSWQKSFTMSRVCNFVYFSTCLHHYLQREKLRKDGSRSGRSRNAALSRLGRRLRACISGLVTKLVLVPPQDKNGKVSGGKDLPSSAAYPRAFCGAIFQVWHAAYRLQLE